MPIFISSTPTIEEDDLKLAKKLLKSKEVSDTSITLPGFEEKRHFYTNMGRSSLYLILKALDVCKDDEIIIQSFTCMALVVPILWLKARPIYTDIDLETYNMTLESLKKRISNKTKAVIVQHTFGIPAPIKEIKKYLDEINKGRQPEQKIYLIEDCAHSLNIKLDDKYIGQYGDASFFSFGQEKVVSTTQGGCAIANDPEIEKSIKEIYEELPDMPQNLVKYNLRYPLLWNIIKKTYFKPSFFSKSNKWGKFTIGKFLILVFRFFGLIKQQASKSEIGQPESDVCKLSLRQKHLLKNQLEKLDRLTRHREEIVEEYSRLLDKNFEGSLIRFPLAVDYPQEVKSRLQKTDVIVGNWYNYPVIPKGVDLDKMKYHVGRCPNAEYIMEHMINLPTGIQVKKEDAEKIAKTVKSHLL
jgi:dTDP-4-amino-4,6-dideoxygalactose transaminase